MTLHLTRTPDRSRIRQGDIFQNVRFLESYSEADGNLEVVMLEFPFVVVLTQDCDLEQNWSARPTGVTSAAPLFDKYLVSVLVAPLYNLEHLTLGENLSPLGVSTYKFNSDMKKKLKSNQLARYHFIKFDGGVISDSVIDFKHYFSVSLSRLELGLNDCICGISPLYRELVSQRFSNYLSRIGLPEPNPLNMDEGN